MGFFGSKAKRWFRPLVALSRFVLILGAVGLLSFGTPCAAGDLETTKMARRFGAGIGAFGPLGTLGFVADFNMSPDFSVMGGLGTGLDYASFMIQARYFLLGEWVSPYFGVGLGRWWTGRTEETQVAPAILRNVFLDPGQDLTRGFSVYFLSPSVGVQFMHSSGFAVSIELEYLFKLFNFANGTYGGINALWYF